MISHAQLINLPFYKTLYKLLNCASMISAMKTKFSSLTRAPNLFIDYKFSCILPPGPSQHYY